MSNPPLVSIIVPTYNRAAYIKESLESALKQTIKDIDIWVVDDGSTDATPELIKEMTDPRIHYIRLHHSGLPSIARNAGIRQSKGRFVAFLDSDDLWLPHKLERQLEAAKMGANIGIYYTLAENFNGSKRYGVSVNYNGKRSGFVFESLLFMNFIPILTVLIPREVLETVGLFDESPELRAIEDYDLLLRIASRMKVHHTSEVLALHRIHEDNIWAFNPGTIAQWEKVLIKNFQGQEISETTKNRALAALELHRFKFSFRKVSTKREAAVHLKKALRLNPFLWPAYGYWVLLYTLGLRALRFLSDLKKKWRERKENMH